MAGKDNLKPVQSKEEARERGRAGGIKSGEVRRRKSSFKNVAKIINNLPLSEINKQKLISMGIPEDETGYTAMMMVSLVKRASETGDIRAIDKYTEYLNQNERLKMEKAKQKKEFEFRERELAIRERELALKEKEFEAKRGNSESESVDKNSNIMSAIKALGIGENNGGN